MTQKSSRRNGSDSPVRTGIFDLSRGCAIGAAVFVWAHQYLATFGTSIPVSAALTLVIAPAFWFAESVTPSLVGSTSRRWLAPVSWIVISVWMAAFGGLLSLCREVLARVPLTSLESDATTLCLMLGLNCLLLLPPLTAAFLVTMNTTGFDSETSFLPNGLTLCGLASGLLIVPTFLAPLAGLSSLCWILVLVCGAAAIGVWYATPRISEQRVARQSAAAPVSLWYPGLSLLIGLQIPLMARVGLQLVPGSAFEHCAIWAGLLGGIGCGVLCSQWISRRAGTYITTDVVLVASAIVIATAVLVPAVWGVLVDGVLAINSSVSSVPLVMALKVLLLGAMILPLGLALGRLWTRNAAEQRQLSGCVAAALAGIVVMQSIMPTPTSGLALTTLLAGLVLAGRYWALGLPTVQMPYRVAGAFLAAGFACLPLVQGNYRPDVAAKLLFSTQVFAARQQGVERDLLPHLDDGRLIAVHEGRESTWTLWKHRGSQLAFRENGVPRGVISCTPETSPQFAGEVMPAVVPLVLHERPESVLMLGVGSSAPLTSVLACPVSAVTCFEQDADLIDLVDTVVTAQVGVNPLNDSRVTLVDVDPTLGLMANDARFDVVIVNEAQPSVASSISQFTREFYQSSQHALGERGILCQRLQYADFGRQPILDLLATVQSVFPQVALLDSAPGEMLIVASSRQTPLVDESTIGRCESLHIRNLMAQVGWDWSVLLNLGALSPEKVAELTRSRGTENTVANGHFAYGLPPEVMRWSSASMPKWKDRQRLLTAHASRMLAWIPESDRTKELQQRLADVVEQQRLIADHPDHFWAYRKTLKERLTERPRGVIRQVKHEGLRRSLHPEDARRKKYLEALGVAATAEDPPAEDIQRLAEFAVPYDPLVSYFLHQEAARLYERSSADDPLQRFQHLRYSIYFGPPNDLSLRNVIQALRLVCDDPGVVADPVDRWDEMNSLLDVLKQRASLRLRLDDSASPFELVDAERSIDVAKVAMEQMDALRVQVGVPESDWQRRKTVLQRKLVRPMWSYHSQQAARIAKLRAQKDAITAGRGADSTTR